MITAPIVFPITTTLNRIYSCRPCSDGWAAGLDAAGKSEPDDDLVSYEAILDSVGLDKALWCCRAEPGQSALWRRYAVWCASQVAHLMTDQPSITALDVAERHASGDATDEELAAARAAASAARAARDAATAAAWAAASAARAAASAASAARAARAARDARAAAWDAQSAAFRQLVTTGTLPAVKQKTVQDVAA